MTFHTKTVTTAALAVAMLAAGSGAAQAQVGSRTDEAQRTRVRFDRPVQIPGGQILPPGTYVFARMDVAGARDNGVQILAEDNTREIAKVMTNDARRNLPTSGTYFEFVDPASVSGTAGASGTGTTTSGTYTGSGSMSGTTSGTASGTTGTTSGTTSGTTGGTSSGSGDTGHDTMGGHSGTTSGTTGSAGTTGTTGSTSGTTPGSTATGTTGTYGSSGTGTTGSTGTTTTTTTTGATGSSTAPLILKAWYFPGTREGQEFVYPDNPDVANRGRTIVMQVGPDYSLRPVADASTTGEASTPGHTSTEDKNKDRQK